MALSEYFMNVIIGFDNLQKKFGKDVILIYQDAGNYMDRAYISWESGQIALSPEFQKDLNNVVSICKTQNVWDYKDRVYFADTLENYTVKIIKTIGIIEPSMKDGAEQILKSNNMRKE